MKSFDAVQQQQALVARHVNAENGHLLDETLATLTDDCVFEDFGLGRRFRGRAGAADYYRLWWNAFGVVVRPGATQEGLCWTTSGVAVAEARYYGSHKGSFLGTAATGNLIELPFTVIITFRNGLMAGERFYYNLGTVLRQIGAPDANIDLSGLNGEPLS